MAYNPDELFTGTAPYYARYRPGYPDQFIELLVKRLELGRDHRVLDLGCGTGQLAVPLSAVAGEVVAVDPDPDMLGWGWRTARDAGITNIRWQLGESARLDTLRLERFDLVAMGSSFHWMNREAVLAELDGMVNPAGAVVLASTGTPKGQPKPVWDEAVRVVREHWLGPDRRAGSTVYTHPTERHEQVLARSAFDQLETLSVRWELDRDLESATALQFSMSYSSPGLLGDRKDAYADAVRAALAELSGDGRFTEPLESDAIIARRSGGSPSA